VTVLAPLRGRLRRFGRRLLGGAPLPDGLDSRLCGACGLTAQPDNPLMDYRHHPDCMVSDASGACDCAQPGFWAHRYRCPVEVEGDIAPPSPF